MELSLEQPQAGLTIRRVDEDAVVVGSQTIRSSFMLTPERLIESWSASSISEIDPEHIEQLLQLKPELVLLGTGERQQFASPEVQAGLLRRGIGLECMDNAACARTYNLLVSEGRHVVAVFLIS
ncbi:MAG: Mth938-like domain-containing protein [Rhodanobacteraceae bacterium]